VGGDGIFERKIKNPLLACIWNVECGFWAGAGKNAVLGRGPYPQSYTPAEYAVNYTQYAYDALGGSGR
jgi:hypothetical protein